ncbi:hypothetical protein HPB50_028237 [Hyalomma asiaticum]|nr:hypothetical protein HPB50_028237 [Hyalomma asiaticum]
MPTVCVVSHCRRLYQKGSDVHFHKVPSEPHRRAVWLRAINRDGPNGMGTLIGFVCSDHFLPEDYETNLNVLRSLGMDTKHARLKRDAVPTQNLGAPPRKRRRSEVNLRIASTAPVHTQTDAHQSFCARCEASIAASTAPAFAPPLHSVPLPSTSSIAAPSLLSHRALSPIHFTPLRSSSPVDSVTSDPEEEENAEQCSEFLPSFNETFSGLDSSTEEVPPQNERKFIIFESCLMQLFKIWHQQQEELFHQLQGCNVDLAGDGRCDSPGFSAKFMTYSLHVAQLNKILHFEQVQVGECEDVKSSTCMEKYAFVKSLKVVKERRLKVTSVTTDRHVQITKHMRMNEPTVKHYFDAWHISKGIKKKLAAHSKRAGCSVLELWIQPASNHLHWCAAISDGNAELLTDMWKSMERHVANVHSGHSGLYTHCAHGDLGERQWLIPDYVDLLLEETARCCEQWPSFKAAFAANPSTAPPPMSHSFPRPSKPELVASRRSRFAIGTTSTTL